MCLDTLLDQRDVEGLGNNGEGYKVVYQQWDAEGNKTYTPPFARTGGLECGRTYTDYKDLMLRTEDNCREYHTGYHIFHTLEGARMYKELLTFDKTFPAILKVQWGGLIACGMQQDHVSLVVKTFTIIEEVEG